ncbi:MAG: sugar phosphate isomerase/epimerase [Litoreibacter sp.]
MDFSYQLYSSRNWPLAETLGMVAELGYKQVEGYSSLYQDAAAVSQLKGLLSETGLSMPTAHLSLDQVESDPQGAIALAKELGIKTVFGPHIDEAERPIDADGWRAFGARLQVASVPLKAAGLGFGWHNHDFEFAPLPDGSLPHDLIFEGGPDLEWEADLAWVIRGGADAATLIRKHNARLTSVHIKDIAPAGDNLDEDGWADVGLGTIDWAGLMKNLRETNCNYFILEHDNPSDHTRFARNSINAVKMYEGET